jgi:signal transduction histidine kinase
MAIPRPLRMRWQIGPLSRTGVLRLGFGGMLLLVVLAAFEGHRIQSIANRQTAEIHRKHFDESAKLFGIQIILYRGSSMVREFLLSRDPNRNSTYRKQLERLDADVKRELAALQQLRGPDREAAQLRAYLDEFIGGLKLPLEWDPRTRSERAIEYIQRDVAPFRSQANKLLAHLRKEMEASLESNDALLQSSRRATLVRLLLILSLTVLLGLLLARFTIRYSKRLEAESERRFAEVKQLSARLIEVQEEERKRLARELHDEIGQTLTALRIEISNAARAATVPTVRARLEQARALAERTVQTVRDISLLLRPSLLDDLGLEPALQWQVQDFSRRTGIHCSFDQSGLDGALPDEYKTCIYRVIQEALNNIQKHANATDVRVVIYHTGTTLRVIVEDNGRGFQVDPHGKPVGRSGLGIVGMKERIELLNGSMQVDSEEGRGTTLLISLPAPASIPEAVYGDTNLVSG